MLVVTRLTAGLQRYCVRVSDASSLARDVLDFVFTVTADA